MAFCACVRFWILIVSGVYLFELAINVCPEDMHYLLLYACARLQVQNHIRHQTSLEVFQVLVVLT